MRRGLICRYKSQPRRNLFHHHMTCVYQMFLLSPGRPDGWIVAPISTSASLMPHGGCVNMSLALGFQLRLRKRPVLAAARPARLQVFGGGGNRN